MSEECKKGRRYLMLSIVLLFGFAFQFSLKENYVKSGELPKLRYRRPPLLTRLGYGGCDRVDRRHLGELWSHLKTLSPPPLVGWGLLFLLRDLFQLDEAGFHVRSDDHGIPMGKTHGLLADGLAFELGPVGRVEVDEIESLFRSLQATMAARNGLPIQNDRIPLASSDRDLLRRKQVVVNRSLGQGNNERILRL